MKCYDIKKIKNKTMFDVKDKKKLAYFVPEI
jgi:hypothetical protein